jgi:hypothetical protein
MLSGESTVRFTIAIIGFQPESPSRRSSTAFTVLLLCRKEMENTFVFATSLKLRHPYLKACEADAVKCSMVSREVAVRLLY